MYDVFISYSRADSQEVEQVYHSLVESGLVVWMDTDGIESGDAFKRTIVDAIGNSNIVLFFSSKSSNSSPWVAKEIGVANHLQKKIIPVRLDDTPYFSEILFDIVNLDFIDYSNPRTRKGCLEKLITDLHKYVVRNDTDEYLYCPRCHSNQVKVKLQNAHLEEKRQDIAKAGLNGKDIALTAGAAAGFVINPILGLGMLAPKAYKAAKKFLQDKEPENANSPEQPNVIMTCCQCGHVFSLLEARIDNKSRE